MGGFDHVRFPLAGGEDRDLCDRWRHAGHRLTYIPTAVVRHAHDLTFTTFCRQHFSYGRGAWVYQRVRAERDSGRLRDDLTFHIQLPRLLGRPLASLPRRQVPAVVILLAVWQVANAVGFFYEARRSTRR
jgi:GT2 family glycosyltransferase